MVIFAFRKPPIGCMKRKLHPMVSPGLKIITTEDGSHSLLREDLNETYHSVHGARGESSYVFIEKGLQYLSGTVDECIYVFEIGLGTGLNAYLAAEFASQQQRSVHFHSIEPFPVPEAVYTRFNYGEDERQQDLLLAIHRAPWGEAAKLTDFFSLVKEEITLEQFESRQQAHIVFFDAFAPSKQAEVWEMENLQKCHDLLLPGGILVTYCAQGQFKRNLAAAGFRVESLPGAMGKKEMVRAHKF